MVKNPTHQQFYDMFIEQLQDVYSAEDQYSQALPKLLTSISTNELKTKLKNHYEEVKKQKDRLGKIFKELSESPEQIFCEGMSGLLKECDRITKEDMPGIVKDAALISALQKVQHYQIATFGALRTFAKHLELKKVQNLLQEILDEEWKADKNLTSVAEGGWFTKGINAVAARK